MSSLEESIVNNINGYELLNHLEKREIYVKHYSGSKIGFMEDHAKPIPSTEQN